MFHEGGGIVHSRFFKCSYSSQVAANLVRRCEATGRCVGSSDETTNGKPILNSEVRNLVYQVDMDSQPRRICCGFPGRTFSENWTFPTVTLRRSHWKIKPMDLWYDVKVCRHQLTRNIMSQRPSQANLIKTIYFPIRSLPDRITRIPQATTHRRARSAFHPGRSRTSYSIGSAISSS